MSRTPEVRFLHTGDWQLGMTRHFLPEEAQARFTQDRFDAVRRLLAAARAEGCAFAVAAGDVFESNQVDRRTVLRGLEAMGESGLPLYLLPGNHDPLDASSVYASRLFLEKKPASVHVLVDARPVQAAEGVEVVGAPWRSKRPLEDLVARSFRTLEPGGPLRVGVAHGALDTVAAVRDEPALIDAAGALRLVEEGRLHYLALGDRHSTLRCDEGGRIWYAGSPEPTDYDETDAGKALLVDLSPDGCSARAIDVGRWRFTARAEELYGLDDVRALERWLEAGQGKERTVLRLVLSGALRLTAKAALDHAVERARDVWAAIEVWGRQRDLAVMPDDEDFGDLGLVGFARDTVDSLRAEAARDDAEGHDARAALALLVRLARREP